MSERTVCDFQRGTGWRASKSNNRGSTSTATRLERDKVMQVRRLRGSETDPRRLNRTETIRARGPSSNLLRGLRI